MALTQTTGWVDAWTSTPSVYAVAARETGDVVAAVNFARENHLRLVVKGGGHSYLGTSNAPDSLLIWTRFMDGIALHDAFVAQGCSGPPQPAVTVGAGAIWMHAYNEVTTKGGRYVQGGGCGTVGVAGLVQGGGFGSYSKRYGTAAASLLEAEIVTADGNVRIANACSNPDLFWALKGGGGGTFGVVTRVTLRTHDLPDLFGFVNMTIEAASDAAFGAAARRFVGFYAESLHTPHWGEIVNIRPGNRLEIQLSSQGLGKQKTEALWQPFVAWVSEAAGDFTFIRAPSIRVGPARLRWNAAVIKARAPGAILSDDRPGAPADNVFWAANLSEAGHFIHGFESLWLPASLLQADKQPQLADALKAAAAHSTVELHFQKGLAGGSAEAIAAAQGHRDQSRRHSTPSLLRSSPAKRSPLFPACAATSLISPMPASMRGKIVSAIARTQEGCAGSRFICRGKQFLREGLAEILLGPELSKTARHQAEIRPGRPVLRPSRRRQRSLERRRIYKTIAGSSRPGCLRNSRHRAGGRRRISGP